MLPPPLVSSPTVPVPLIAYCVSTEVGEDEPDNSTDMQEQTFPEEMDPTNPSTCKWTIPLMCSISTSSRVNQGSVKQVKCYFKSERISWKIHLRCSVVLSTYNTGTHCICTLVNLAECPSVAQYALGGTYLVPFDYDKLNLGMQQPYCAMKWVGCDSLPPAEEDRDEQSQGEDGETQETDAVVSTWCTIMPATCQLLLTHCCRYNWSWLPVL